MPITMCTSTSTMLISTPLWTAIHLLLTTLHSGTLTTPPMTAFLIWWMIRPLMAMTAQATKSPFLLTPATTSTLKSMIAGLAINPALTLRMSCRMLNSGLLLTKAHTCFRLQRGLPGNSLTQSRMEMTTTTTKILTGTLMKQNLMMMSSMESHHQKTLP